MTAFRRNMMQIAEQREPSLLFSISPTQKVEIAKGNLQYNPALDKWRFDPVQYHTIGSANSNISATYNGWLDLIGWGCSGWSESGATYYQPYSSATNGAYYYVGGSYTNSLVGAYAEADWAWHNAIDDYAPHTWRVMTRTEWQYLMYRTLRNATASVEGNIGMIVLPDDWTTPAGVSIVFNDYTFSTNSYTAEQWNILENRGAVFLPISGIRLGTSVTNINSVGCYWSTTYSTKYKSGYGYMAYCMVEGPSRVEGWEAANQSYRSQGMMIRPIREV